MKIHIRPVQEEELEQLHQIAVDTFSQAFSSDNSLENLSLYLEEKLSIERISAAFFTPGVKFFFAESDEVKLGYLRLNSGDAQTEHELENALEIERIYLLSPYYGQGIGQKILDFAIEYAHEEGVHWVWLGVWEHNHGAKKFYERNGFTAFSKHIFMLGNDEQMDVLMKLSIASS